MGNNDINHDVGEGKDQPRPYGIGGQGFRNVRAKKQAFDALSVKETEVATRFLKSFDLQLVAMEQGCTVRTVRYHLEKIRDKMGERSSLKAIKKAVDLGFMCENK